MSPFDLGKVSQGDLRLMLHAKMHPQYIFDPELSVHSADAIASLNGQTDNTTVTTLLCPFLVMG